jgi:hypothetical protein
MANLKSNPWSFLQTDVVTTTVTSLTLNADTTVTAVVAATGSFAAGNDVTVADNTSASGVYNGFYSIISITNGTTMVLQQGNVPPFIPAGTGAAGATGSVSLCQYPNWVRAEDMKWDKVVTSASLDVRDRNGNIVWQATQPSTANVPPNWNRGKVFWINGLTLLSIGNAPSILMITVN